MLKQGLGRYWGWLRITAPLPVHSPHDCRYICCYFVWIVDVCIAIPKAEPCLSPPAAESQRSKFYPVEYVYICGDCFVTGMLPTKLQAEPLMKRQLPWRQGKIPTNFCQDYQLIVVEWGLYVQSVNLNIIRLVNALLPVWCRAIIWSDDDLLLMSRLGTNLS